MVKKTEIDNPNYWRFLSHPNEYIEHWNEKYYGQELKIETTERQFRTAAKILNLLKKQKGVLLADDVGLGKTTVAVLVACVYAGKGNKVAILAPNENPMQKKWEQEISNHVEIVSSVANNLDVKLGENKQLPDNIRVMTHYTAEKARNTDLLIIDEAHRAKGENSKFAEKISAIMKKRQKIIILTATPFSINIEELNRMLEIIEAPKDVKNHVKIFCNQLEELWCSDNLSPVADFSTKLTLVAKETIHSLKDYVIRHGIKDLKEDEQKHFGNEESMHIDVEMPEQTDYEIHVRMNRLLYLSKKYDLYDGIQTNDARYHVGWKHLKEDVESVDMNLSRKRDKKYSIIKCHIQKINNLLDNVDNHKKAEGVADKVKEIVEGEGEKVLIFCRHHATAREITTTIYSKLHGKQQLLPNKKIWGKLWEEIIIDGKPENAPQNYDECISDYISWLCSKTIRSQIASWIGNSTNADELKDALKKKYVRNLNKMKISDKVIISDEAIKLFIKLIDNKSISKMNDFSLKMPVFSTAECPNDDDLNFLYFPFRNQIDTVMAIFNSPFGPDVLVTTDRLSEGIDLHGCCRNLIHYELDPSPIRIMQRNGRIRRVNSWAARTNKSINIAYPIFKGTRDEKLVNIMKGRIKKFDLLLGGVGGKIEIDDNNDLEKYRLDIVEKAKTNMKGLSLALDP